MKNRCTVVASVLYFVCISALGMLAAIAFEFIYASQEVNFTLCIAAVISGFIASYLYAFKYNGNQKAKEIMKTYFFLLFLLYLFMLTDLTLIDDTFGRNIFNILDWDKEALAAYLKEDTNIIPFYTVKLFLRGYLNDRLSLTATVVNIFGNFAALMPIPFFIKLFFKKYGGAIKVLLAVLAVSLSIELLQFIFLTGACDIDDIILNTSGAMLFYFILKKEKSSQIINKLTHGAWK